MRVSISTYGGIVTALTTPDEGGDLADVVLGFDDLESYLAGHPYFGAIVGRYGNRIAQGTFELDGTTFELARNNNGNHIHGGIIGFDKKLWTAIPRQSAFGPQLRLQAISEDGEEGYPGRLDLEVTYTLTHNNELRIQYRATTDRPTPINLTNHSYFNLTGSADCDILDHDVSINAARFTPVDSTLIPTGEIRDVAGTPMDFREPTAIGARIDAPDRQLEFGNGYDHNWILGPGHGELRLAATVLEPSTGRVMEVLTTEPGLQFYTANFLDGTLVGKQGVPYHRRSALCLETQHFPDSPNRPEFPNTVLRPGRLYETTTVYRFGTKRGRIGQWA